MKNMIIIKDICNNKGSVLIIVSVIIVALVIIGMYAMKSSTIEIKVAGNQWEYTEDFFCADSSMDYLLTNYNFMGKSTISIGSSSCQAIPVFLSAQCPDTTACYTRLSDGVPDPAKHSVTDFTARRYSIQSQNQDQSIISEGELVVPKN